MSFHYRAQLTATPLSSRTAHLARTVACFDGRRARCEELKVVSVDPRCPLARPLVEGFTKARSDELRLTPRRNNTWRGPISAGSQQEAQGENQAAKSEALKFHVHVLKEADWPDPPASGRLWCRLEQPGVSLPQSAFLRPAQRSGLSNELLAGVVGFDDVKP